MDEIKRIIHNYDDEEDEEEDDDDEMDVSDGEHEKVEFTENNCKCGICDVMNKIYGRWQAWTPQTPFDIIVKKNIDTIPVEDWQNTEYKIENIKFFILAINYMSKQTQRLLPKLKKVEITKEIPL